MLSLSIRQRANSLPERVFARRLFVGALSTWVIVFAAIRAWALAHGGTPVPWDASWYLDVAMRGYQFNGDISFQQNVAFLPAYPYVLRLFLALGLPSAAAVLVMSIVCSAGGDFFSMSSRMIASVTPAGARFFCAPA